MTAKKTAITLCILAAVFLLLYLPLLPTPGLVFDLPTQKKWGDQALNESVSSLYSKYGTDYPPLYLYVFKFNAWLNRELFEDPEAHYPIIFKTIPMLCNLIVGLLLFFYLRKESYKTALLASSFYLFNFALIYNTAFWGQVDAVNAMLMFLSVLLLMRGNFMASTIFFTLAVLTKVQSVILLPVLVVVIIKKSRITDILKMVFANAVVFFAVLLPYILGGVFWKVMQVMVGSVGQYPYVTANAYNFWYVFSPTEPSAYMHGLRDDFTILGVSLQTIGFILLSLYTLLVIYQLWKKTDARNIALAAASMAFAFFMLPTQIHERYLFPFFALFALIAFKEVRYIWVYAAISFAHLINLMSVYRFDVKMHPIYLFQALANLLWVKLSFFVVTLSISAINIVLFLYLSYTGIFKDLLKNLKQDLKKIRRII